MQIKTKKKNFDGIVRLETSGVLKEILMSEDFLRQKDAKITLCFKGKASSGIVELSVDEADIIVKEIQKRRGLLSGAQVMKFEK